MTRKKAPTQAVAGRSIGAGSLTAREAQPEALDTGPGPKLTEVDREIIGVLTDFRDVLRGRTSLATKYTVCRVGGVVPPPQLGPEDVRKTREALGLSQPVFAHFLGTSPSTIRSWEQGQKLPSPMARRFLGLVASDLPYWKSQLTRWSM